MVYKRDPVTDPKRLETLRISPSSINCFRQCPRKWYGDYILALESVATLPLIRGNVVHFVLEEMFKQKFVPGGEAFRPHMMNKALKLFNSKWEEDVKIEDLGITQEEENVSKEECETMINRFFTRYCDNIQLGIKIKKFSSETQGFYFTRPIFKELWIDDEYKIMFNEKWKRDYVKKEDQEQLDNPLHVGGFIDSVQKDFEDNMILIDYKTSSKYKNALSEDYVLQLSIYAYLWQRQTGKLPTYVGINYLKYDESFYILVTPHLIAEAVDKIKQMRNNLIEWKLDESQYYCKISKLCDWCSRKPNCDAWVKKEVKE